MAGMSVVVRNVVQAILPAVDQSKGGCHVSKLSADSVLFVQPDRCMSSLSWSVSSELLNWHRVAGRSSFHRELLTVLDYSRDRLCCSLGGWWRSYREPGRIDVLTSTTSFNSSGFGVYELSTSERQEARCRDVTFPTMQFEVVGRQDGLAHEGRVEHSGVLQPNSDNFSQTLAQSGEPGTQSGSGVSATVEFESGRESLVCGKDHSLVQAAVFSTGSEACTSKTHGASCQEKETPSPESWWSIGDSISEKLHLPNGFDQHVEKLFNMLKCRLDSRELLLRVLVHRSYYEANMPVAIRDQKKETLCRGSAPVPDGTTQAISAVTFSECHYQARQNLALLGDGLLSFITIQSLIHERAFRPSGGEVTQRRSQLVCNNNLGRVWSSCGLDFFPLAHLSVAERNGSKTQVHLYSDTFEALLGALNEEKGFQWVADFVKRQVLPLLWGVDKVPSPIASLQELTMVSLHVTPTYKLIGIDNKDTPLQVFRVRVYVKGVRMATGLGSSHKLAKQDAARKAVLKWPERIELLSNLPGQST